MKTSLTIGVLLAAGAIFLPSCETDRVNEHPIGIYPTNNVYPSGVTNIQNDSLLNDVQRESPTDSIANQNSGFDPDPARVRNGTINNLVGEPSNITPRTPAVSDPVSNNDSSTIASPRPVSTSTASSSSSSIPVAWPTSDPTVVISPYDRTKKIKILNRSTNKPYPSGTVLRDTNYPNEIKKFRVP